MRSRLVLLVGLLVFAVPAVAASLALRSRPDPYVWETSPPEPPLPEPEPPATWDQPARESLGLLRRITMKEARRSLATLASCEARAARAGSAQRNRRYRTCATDPLARTHAFAAANSHMLSGLAGSANPDRACRGRVLALSGVANSLAFAASSTLRGGLDAPWQELLDASRSIRGLAAETLRLARRPGWASACRPRPRAKAPAARVI